MALQSGNKPRCTGEHRKALKEDLTMKTLYKSKTKKMIAGVCGGIAEYFGIDPTLVRLGFVALSFLFGGGVLVYIIAAIIMPEEP